MSVTNKEKNFISAVVYLHNDGAQAVRFFKALNAVLDQHFEQYELVAVDDACADDTIPTLRDWAKALEKLGILPDAVESAGKAALLLDRLNKRRDEGLTTPKQIRCLEKYGFQHVGPWSFEAARHMIDRIAAQGWRGVPKGVNPRTYTPAAEPPAADSPFDFGW